MSWILCRLVAWNNTPLKGPTEFCVMYFGFRMKNEQCGTFGYKGRCRGPLTPFEMPSSKAMSNSCSLV